MTTAAAAYQIVPRGEVHPSPLNPRKAFDQAKLQELADSMKDGKGIIEPLVVRLGKKNGYELVAGERRWRASELAGLTEVPIVVRELKDHEVLELMLIENKQRADLGPLEEADSYKQLMQLTGYDVDQVAHKIGMSVKYVYDRVKLLALVPEAKKLLLDGVITAGHAIIIARQKPDVQKRILKPTAYEVWEQESNLFDSHDERQKARKANPYAGMKVCTVRELSAWIDANVALDVASAGELFPETAEAAAAAKVVSITLEWHIAGPRDANKDASGKPIYVAQDAYNSFGLRWRLADGTKGNPKCEHAAVGVVVIGPRRGTALPAVCVSDNPCETHWPKPKVAKSTTPPPARSAAAGTKENDDWKKRQAAQRKLEEQRRAREKREEEAWKAAQPFIQEAIITGLKKASAAKLVAIVTENLYSGNEKAAAKLIPGTDASAALQRLALSELIDDIEGAPKSTYVRKDLFKTAAGLGVKLEPILKAHAPTEKQPAKPATKKPAAKTPAKKASKKKGAAKR